MEPCQCYYFHYCYKAQYEEGLEDLEVLGHKHIQELFSSIWFVFLKIQLVYIYSFLQITKIKSLFFIISS